MSHTYVIVLIFRAVARDVHYGDKSCYFNTSFPVQDGQVGLPFQNPDD
jgi:hypothetical protein